MIRKISETNPMRHFATHECVYEWKPEMSLAELNDILSLIGSVDGANSEEVIWVRDRNSEYRTKGIEMKLLHEPTPGKDWYWCFPNRVRRDEVLVYLTTEKQQTYFSMAPTGNFPEEDEAEAILNKIRARAPWPATVQQAPASARCDSALDAIRARAGVPGRRKK